MFEEEWDDSDSSSVAGNPQQTQYYGRRDGVYKSKKSDNNGRSFKSNVSVGFSNDKKKKIFPPRNSLSMKVEGNKIGKIIGRQGCKIKELQEQTNTKIKIGDQCEDNSYYTNVFIIGDEESQKKCKTLIEELVCESKLVLISDPELKAKSEVYAVPIIDWDAVNASCELAEKERWAKCPPLKKDFYIEDPEVANMTEEEVQDFRRKNNNIVVQHVSESNEKILNPVKTFSQAFQHYPEILREIEKQGFDTPSPIQCQAWPVLLSGKDMIGIAQTGTGKTLAYLLPALIHIDGQEIPRSQRGGANVLVVAPTRELALQIEKEVQKYSYRDIKCVCIYGGGSRREQVDIVTKGVEIIIATPGRLNDLVLSKVIDVSSITYMVLDEADRMLDMGFEPQIRKVLFDIRPDRQSVMTSATWPPDVQRLAGKYMVDPIQVYIGSLDLAAVHSVAQTVLIVDDNDKKDYLLDFIGSLADEDKTIIFVGRKITADRLSCDLTLDRIWCQSIHGDRDQEDREQALEDIKTGAVKILIATDVASRGIDIADVTKVFNYDFPKNIEEYVHRVGRTGRAGKTGEAITLFTRDDWAYAGELITILEEANQAVPQELYDMRDRFQRRKEKKMAERGSGRGGRGGRRSFGNRSDTWNFY